jgi:hypothetical protein
MLLANSICAASIQLLNLLTICGLERPKHTDVARLQLTGGVRGQSTKDDITFEAESQGFE